MIGVIADDLTGAAELGGVGLRYGLRAEVILGGKCDTKADLLCVDTDSRSCTPREAALRAAAAARKLQNAGAVWIYKKVDSVLRGHVLAEVGAVQNALGLRSSLLIPANPCFGRVIRDGQYYVNGKPIHETDFARDPEYPRSSCNVLEMLGACETHTVTIRRLREELPAFGIALGEVASSNDVRKWARRATTTMLLAGGAEFFGALLNLRFAQSKMRLRVIAASHRESSRKIRELFVCGSTSDFTEQFVSEADARGTPVFSLLDVSNTRSSFGPKTLRQITYQAIRAFRSHPRIVLAVGRPLIERRTVARKLSRQLVEIAVRVLKNAKPDHLYAEGGATAAELVRHLRWNRMKVLQELAPGVTTLSLPNGMPPRLTIKPGSYPGWPKASRR